MYDFTIIGGGPSGIYCADKLSLLGYKVCLIEKLESLGGCHRVRYTENKNEIYGGKVHTEHGPRVYLGAYLDFWKWIQDVGVSRNNNFTEYITSSMGEDIIDYSIKFNIYELVCMAIVYFIQNVLRLDFSENYTIDDFMEDFYFSDEGKTRLNRICRLIDGGNTDKTTIISLFKGLDVGLAYYIYEPIEPMDTLLWDKFYHKLNKQKVNIRLNTEVFEIKKGKVVTNRDIISTNNIILCIPPFVINKIINAPLLCGYDVKTFHKLSDYQQYEPYICATIEFENISSITRWGISGDHPWGLVDIDNGRYFNNVKGSMYVVSVTHPEKIDPKTNRTANDMNKTEFLNRIVEIIQERFQIKEEPIKKSLSPNVEKINGGWIEIDRAFLYSPPGWLKPDFNISKKNKVYTTGHHIGESYHEYNSMESAIQNASELLSKIEPKYNYEISKPWKLSDFIWIGILLLILIIILYIYRVKLKKKIKYYIRL